MLLRRFRSTQFLNLRCQSVQFFVQCLMLLDEVSFLQNAGYRSPSSTALRLRTLDLSTELLWWLQIALCHSFVCSFSRRADILWRLSDFRICESNVYWTVHHCNSWRMKDQLDVTCYFISLLMCSTCFRHQYIHHQELATVLLNYHIGRLVL